MKKLKENNLGLIALFIPLIAIITYPFLFYVSKEFISIEKIMTIYLGVAFISATLLSIEMKQFDYEHHIKYMWLYDIGLFLVFPISFVIYFFERKHLGYRSYGFISLIIAILFLITTSYYIFK